MHNVFACSGEKIEISEAPEKVNILPLGNVHSQKGDFIVDKESFELIRSQFEGRQLDLVIDYEHQTLLDVQAPAAGWIKELSLEEDAVVARVEWTPKAKEYLKNKEYRYLSPVVLVRKTDKKVTAIHSVALTNTPAIDGMFAVVNSLDLSGTIKGEINMDLKEIAKLFGLPETATSEEITKTIEEAVKAAEQLKTLEGDLGAATSAADGKEKDEVVANNTILGLLNLSSDAKTEDVAASIMSLKSGDMDVKAEILALKQQMQEKKMQNLVEMALKAGKITAGQKEWAEQYALKDPKGFEGFVEKAPVVVPQGKMSLADAPKTSLEDVDTAILKNCGIDPKDVKKFLESEA